jgi:hypothetical protein
MTERTSGSRCTHELIIHGVKIHYQKTLDQAGFFIESWAVTINNKPFKVYYTKGEIDSFLRGIGR